VVEIHASHYEADRQSGRLFSAHESRIALILQLCP
jgi:hypothetical protein